MGQDIDFIVLNRLHDPAVNYLRSQSAGRERRNDSCCGRRQLPPKQSGRVAAESKIDVVTPPGHSTDTPMPEPANSCSSASESTSTAYFVIA